MLSIVSSDLAIFVLFAKVINLTLGQASLLFRPPLPGIGFASTKNGHFHSKSELKAIVQLSLKDSADMRRQGLSQIYSRQTAKPRPYLHTNLIDQSPTCPLPNNHCPILNSYKKIL